MSDRLIIDAIQATTMVVFRFRRYRDFVGPCRQRHLARPRMLAMYLARVLTSASYPEIGRHFGGRHHATVIHAVQTVERKIADGAEGMAEAILDISQIVQTFAEKDQTA